MNPHTTKQYRSKVGHLAEHAVLV